MSTTEEQSAKIIAEADALLKTAMVSILKTRADLASIGPDALVFEDSLNIQLGDLPPEDRDTIKRLSKTLAAIDMGEQAPAASAAKSKKSRAMI